MSEGARSALPWERLVDAALGGLGVLSGGEFARVNEALVREYGFETESDLLGRSWRELYGDAARERIEAEVLPAVETSGAWRGTVAGRRADGTTCEQELSVRRLGDGHLAWAVDGAERGETTPWESSQGTSRSRSGAGEPDRDHAFTREVVDALDDVLYVLDEEGELYLWNERATEATGYTDAELASIDPAEMLPPQEETSVRELADAIYGPDDESFVLDLVTKSGERVPHEIRGRRFEDPTTGRRFWCGIARDVTDRLEREAELEQYETMVETVDDGIYVLDADLALSFVNGAFCDIVGRSRAELLGTSVMDLFTEEDEAAFANEMRERVVDGDTSTGTVEGTVEREDGETIHTEARYRLHPAPEDGFAGSVGVVRDVTERKEREERLRRQHDELETLSRINELLHEVIRELFVARTRERIEHVVCERLAESGFYRFAWVGERATADDRVVPRVAAGDGDGYLDAVDVSVAEEAAGRGPAGRALRTGEVRVSQDIGNDPSFAPWREAALERGFRSVAAVPLVHEDTTYGVLAVYASRAEGFSEREQAGLAVLGDTIGFALRALDDRRLLFADAVVELEFRVTDAGPSLVAVSEALDCRLELDGHLATGDGGWVAYVEVSGAAVAPTARAIEDRSVVDAVRTVREDDDGGLLEVGFGAGSFLDTVSELGARIASVSADAGAARVVVEAPATADTRDLVGRLESAYPGTELLARSEYDRSVGEVDLPGGPMDALTDRQRQVLETAYRAGYFAWPRESTGEEVAETLDVAAPTLHAHLRKAEERLLSELLD